MATPVVEVSRGRVVAIVQARMGSSRLPGKVLRPIAGQPLLWHVVHRLRRCRTLDAIIVAASDDPRDDAIESFCREEGVEIVRGTEDNVLARFVLAAQKARADIIVRVSSDAPFIDAGFIDKMVETLIAADGDYVLPEPGSLCAHEGVDPFSRRALDRLAREAADDPIAREHVTGYFKLHPDFVRIVHVVPDPGLAHEGARLTIDTPDDLAFAAAVHERMRAKAGEVALSDLLSLLVREPLLKAVNAHVQQKPLRHTGGRALIYCDGGGVSGFGHVKRCLMLSRALRDREGFGVGFALNGDAAAAALVRAAGFETILLSPDGQAEALASAIASDKPDILVVDAREKLSQADLSRLAAQVGIAAIIDDVSDRRLAATHAYYAPLPQVAELSWAGSACLVRVGWEWSLLGFDAAGIVRGVSDSPAPCLVVSAGGSDPRDFTRLALLALRRIDRPFRARFVIGPGFRDGATLLRDIEAARPSFEAVLGVADLSGEFAAADLALAAFGVTAYELAALGVPALYLALSEDHARSASAFVAAGMGEIVAARSDDIVNAVSLLLRDAGRRRTMAAAGRNAIDGKGAQRIATDLAGAAAGKRMAAPS